ncbi:D-glycero-beta-D-manno-heptose 1-phosphate adenylyltransferase [Polymorphospora sp. NPDC050346]|uniref:D-glycero-beta-D-manno-heptose 1-phosphate adenylyltransferase n=1 Tax=Polymorphospora sp. NPDC050346 TaxID=3155780 RepID=UPI0033E9586D
MSEVAAVVDNWADREVLVVGDAMLDEWRFADTDRLCREAPAPVLTLRHRLASAGGAANTAVNVAALGGRATLVAPVGADTAGGEVRACLDRAGVRDHTLLRPGHPTPVKRRLLAADQILVREDEGGPAGPLPDDAVRLLLDVLTDAVEVTGPGAALVICDYGLGALPGPVRAWLLAHRHRFDTVALDAHDLTPWGGLAPTVVTPSLGEAHAALRPGSGPPPGSPPGPAAGSPERVALAESYLPELRRRTGADVVALTLDVDGSVVSDGVGSPYRSHADPVPASHAVGAGDVYLAAITLALTTGVPAGVAAGIAQSAASRTLDGPGTCVCDRDRLVATPGPTGTARRPVVDAAALVAAVDRQRTAGARIVFTNGCFDMLHRGHVRFLEQAAELGDVLVVAVNSDDSVRRLKGRDRPVNPVEDRVAVLAALSCVDHVVTFAADSPADLLRAVRPEVYVKGGDYPPDLVPEAPLVRGLGGEVRILGYVPDRSTSAIIERIRSRSRVGSLDPTD